MEESVARVFKLTCARLVWNSLVLMLKVVFTLQDLVRCCLCFQIRGHNHKVQGEVYSLTFDDSIGGALKKACEHNRDSDAMHLPQTAQVVHRKMFEKSFLLMVHSSLVPRHERRKKRLVSTVCACAN